MSITLIDEKQIKDYRSWTGTFLATGVSISGDVAISGLTSGTAGYFRSATVEDLTVSNALISPYLSGIIGTSVTGSGIVHFLSTPTTSGNNLHFRHVIHTGDATYPIQGFSSYENAADWYYFNNGAWTAFPALGLPAPLQNDSLIRHVWSPTGMNVFDKYYSNLQTVFAGNVTGGYNNSSEFQSPTQGFTINHIPFWQSYYDTADSRYIRRIQYGPDYVPSGIKVSGVPIILPVSGSVPPDNHGNGTLVQVGSQLYTYNTNGYYLVSTFTGVSVPTGYTATGTNLFISGMGNTTTTIIGDNVIGISGGVDSFAVTSGVARKGNLIVSGAGYLQVTEILSATGTMLVFSGIGDGTGTMDTTGPGNVTGIGINLNADTILSTGGFVISGEGGTSVRMSDLGNNISGIIVSGSAAGGIGNVTGIGANLNAGEILYTGGFVVTGEGSVTTRVTNLGNNISGIVISGTNFVGGAGNITGVGVNLNAGTILYTGGFVISGEGGASVRISNLGNNVSGIIVSGSTATAGGIGNVTGLGVDLLLPLYTGGFVVTGGGAITTSLTNLGDNISGILISGTPVINNNYNTISGEVNVTGIGVHLNGGTILYTGGFVITGQNGISTYLVDQGNNISSIVVSGTVNSVYAAQHPFTLESGLIIDDGLTFGYVTYVNEMEGWLQVPGSGTGVTISLQNNDVEVGTLTIPQLSGRAEAAFSPALAFAADERFTLKISQCPDAPYEGQNLRVRVHYHT